MLPSQPQLLVFFDLFFVILNECDELADYNVAKHILDVHRCEETTIDVAFTKHIDQEEKCTVAVIGISYLLQEKVYQTRGV